MSSKQILSDPRLDQEVNLEVARAIASMATTERSCLAEVARLESRRDSSAISSWFRLLRSGLWYAPKYQEACEAAIKWAERLKARGRSRGERKSLDDAIGFFRAQKRWVFSGRGKLGSFPTTHWERLAGSLEDNGSSQVWSRWIQIATDRAPDVLPCSFIVREGRDPLEAIESIGCCSTQPTIIECGLALHVAVLRAMRSVLGDRRLSDILHRVAPEGLGLSVCAPPLEGVLASRRVDTPELGNYVYLPNHRDYLKKHPQGIAQGFNGIVSAVKDEPILEFLGAPEEAMPLSAAIEHIVDCYNRAPNLDVVDVHINHAVESLRLAQHQISAKDLPPLVTMQISYPGVSSMV